MESNSITRKHNIKKPEFVNKALSNYDLLQWIDYLKISNFKGIYSKGQHMPSKHSPCIIDLDSYENVGTRWVCCASSSFSNNTLWYFNSFGMQYPEEYKTRAKKMVYK